MQELLKNFCFSDKTNGLLLIDMPTGTGKTYNSIQYSLFIIIINILKTRFCILQI